MKNQLTHKGRKIGELRGKHLIKTGKQVVLFRNYDGFGLSKDVLDLIEDVTVHYQGKIYKARTEDFWSKGIRHSFMGDEQLILPRKYWTYKDRDQLTLI